MRTQVLVITKAPVPGRSKTRLSPPCTPEQAAGIAAAAVGDTLDAVRAAPMAGRVVALDGAPGDLELDGFRVVPQADGDLGTRLAAAFADAMADGPVPTLLIGMDTPQVTPGLLVRCASMLESSDAGHRGARDGAGRGLVGAGAALARSRRRCSRPCRCPATTPPSAPGRRWRRPG